MTNLKFNNFLVFVLLSSVQGLENLHQFNKLQEIYRLISKASF